MSSRRRNLTTVDRPAIRKILELGHEFDVNKGSYYDARLGCVNIWCGPDDKPACWNKPIIQGDLNYPRDYVATLSWEWENENDTATLWIEAEPHSLLDSCLVGFVPHRHAPQLTETEWEQILDWAQDKSMFLVRMASIHPDTGIQCPFCPRVMPQTGWNAFLDFVRHIEETHEKQVGEIILGGTTSLVINGEVHPLQLSILKS